MAVKITYSEPIDYIPKSIRKELKIGEYAPQENNTPAKSTKTPAKSGTKKSK